MATTYTRRAYHGEELEDMIDKNVNIQDNGIQKNAIPQDDGVEEITILPDDKAMWIMKLHKMGVIRKQSKKTYHFPNKI